MVELLPLDRSNGLKAMERFYRLFPECEGWLEYGVKEGFLQCRLITWEEQPLFALWFELAPDGRMIIHAAQALKDKPAIEVLQLALIALLELHKPCFIEFRTQRRGLVKQLQKLGCVVQSVILIYKPNAPKPN